MKKNRPLSPHISIYKPQISSMMSIIHRASGIFLFVNFLILVWIFIFILGGFTGFFEAPLEFSEVIHLYIFRLYILLVLACLYYHLLNGIRHLFFDLGKGLELSAMKISGWAVIGLTCCMTIFSATWIL